MGDVTKASAALGQDVTTEVVDEWLEKAAASLEGQSLTMVAEMVADLTSKMFGNRLAVAYLKTVTARPERIGRETLKPCRECDSTWIVENVEGHVCVEPCPSCRPEQHARYNSIAPSDLHMGGRNHLNHQSRTTLHDGSDRWGCEVCRDKHGGKAPLSSASAWA